MDDHYYVNTIAGSTIDIIEYDLSKNNFNKHWHTRTDDVINIRETLKAVGQTVLEVIYKE